MLILASLIGGVLMCYVAYAVFILSWWNEEYRKGLYLATALIAAPAMYFVVWAVVQIVTLS